MATVFDLAFVVLGLVLIVYVRVKFMQWMDRQ